MANKLVETAILRRSSQSDILFGFVWRDTGVDVMVKWDGTQFVAFTTLIGTHLKYSAVSWLDKLYWVDGKNPMLVTDGTTVLATPTDSPIVQYLTVFQDRLVGAGDARDEAEVIADSEIWPEDSNRDRVLYCETIDPNTWSPNNFIDCRTGTGEHITGLTANAYGTSTEGAQTQLVIFKDVSFLVHSGELGGADVTLSIPTSIHGCPSQHGFALTPFGVCFVSQKTVMLMKPQAQEPEEIGFAISQEIFDPAHPDDSTPEDAAAVYHNHMLKIFVNDKEWFLDMRPAIWPQEQNWYGPMTGDHILKYELYAEKLISAQVNTTTMWELDVEEYWSDMDSFPLDQRPRESIMEWSRIMNPNMMLGKIDAVGFHGETKYTAGQTQFEFKLDYDRGTAYQHKVWTSRFDDQGPIYPVIRLERKPSHDIQVTTRHQQSGDFKVHALYLRSKEPRKQSVNQKGSTQT